MLAHICLCYVIRSKFGQTASQRTWRGFAGVTVHTMHTSERRSRKSDCWNIMLRTGGKRCARSWGKTCPLKQCRKSTRACGLLRSTDGCCTGISPWVSLCGHGDWDRLQDWLLLRGFTEGISLPRKGREKLSESWTQDQTPVQLSPELCRPGASVLYNGPNCAYVKESSKICFLGALYIPRCVDVTKYATQIDRCFNVPWKQIGLHEMSMRTLWRRKLHCSYRRAADCGIDHV